MNYKPRLLVILDFNENGLFDITMELRKNYYEGAFETCLANIRERDVMNEVFQKYRPDIVFHAAAHKHVPMMEGNLREALINNVVGTNNVVEASIACGVERFMLISTDKAVNPTNIMGATKRIAELLIQQKNRSGNTRFAAVRFGNVLGSHSSVIPIFQRQLQVGGPLTVMHKDVTRYFMTIPEAVQLVLESASIMQGGEIFVLDMGEPIRIYDLATTMIKLAGLVPKRISRSGDRPTAGRKLHEELCLPEETVVTTSNNKIYVMRPEAANPIRNRTRCCQSCWTASTAGTRPASVIWCSGWFPRCNTERSVDGGRMNLEPSQGMTRYSMKAILETVFRRWFWCALCVPVRIRHLRRLLERILFIRQTVRHVHTRCAVGGCQCERAGQLQHPYVPVVRDARGGAGRRREVGQLRRLRRRSAAGYFV